MWEYFLHHNLTPKLHQCRSYGRNRCGQTSATKLAKKMVCVKITLSTKNKREIAHVMSRHQTTHHWLSNNKVTLYTTSTHFSLSCHDTQYGINLIGGKRGTKGHFKCNVFIVVDLSCYFILRMQVLSFIVIVLKFSGNTEKRTRKGWLFVWHTWINMTFFRQIKEELQDMHTHNSSV